MKIPLEVFGSIVAYNSTDPSTLINLSIVSRDLRAEAERVLYKDVFIAPKNQDTSKGRACLQTLNQSPEKARLVRTFEFAFWSVHDPRGLCHLLCAVLPKMSGLKTLIIRASQDYDGRSMLAALRRSTFSLDYFLSSHHLNLARCALDHPSLIAVAVEGLEMEYYKKSDVNLFRDLASSSRSQGPLAVSSHFRSGTAMNALAVFPAFSPVVNGVTSWSADPIEKLYTIWFGHAPSTFRHIHIVVESFADQTSMSKIMSSIARSFPKVSSISFVVRDNRIDLHPESLSISLSAFTALKDLDFCFDLLGQASTAGAFQTQTDRLRLAHLFAERSSSLSTVGFPDGTRTHFIRS